LGLIFAPTSALSGDFAIELDLACFSLDGAPIPKGTVLAAKCCGGGGNQAEECRVGFNSMIGTNMYDAQKILDTAYQELQNSKVLNGNSTDFTNPPDAENDNTTDPSTSSGTVDSENSALLSGGETSPLIGKSSANGNPFSKPSSSSGASGSSMFGGGGSGADSSWTSGRGKKSKVAALGSEGNDPMGKYSSNESKTGSVPDSRGASGVTSSLGEGVLEFGSGKDGAGDGSADSNTGGSRGGDGSSASGGALGSDGAGAGTGSLEDATDYLTRIHKKDSIFKIVTRRYQKEEQRKNILSRPQ
jgi:hypothetical protein